MIDFDCDVKLRRIEEGDLEQLRAWRNDYSVRKWTRQMDLIASEDQKAWFQRQAGDSSVRMYSILNDEGGLVGVCGLTSIDLINRRAEFSLYIGREHRQCGYGRAALASLLRHGFQNWGLAVIWGESFAGNPAHSLFKSVGFKEEGIRRNFYFREGQFVNAHLFSMLGSEFDWNSALGQSSGS